MQANPKTSDTRTTQVQRVADRIEKHPVALAAALKPPEKLLRLPAVMAIVGLQKSSIYEGVKNGTFPAPVKLSRRAVCWPESRIAAWVDERIHHAYKFEV